MTPRVNLRVGAALLLAVVPLVGHATDEPPLIGAIKAQDRVAVTTLLKQHADVNARQVDGTSALHWAVYREDVSLVDALLAAGADANATNDVGMTPLMMACATTDGAIVEHLLEKGARSSTTLASGETALMRAARVGNVVGVKALLQRGAAVNDAEQTRGQTALMWAVANKHPEIVSALLASGADVRARSHRTSAVYNMGGSRSAGTGNRETTVYEIDQGSNTALLFAARSGDVESARLLLDAGASVTDAGADGNPVLVVAVHSGNASVASLLVDRGADVNAAPLGYTALHAAVLRGTLRDRNLKNTDPMAGAPIVKKLLDHGAKPNVPFTKGTPLRRWSHDFVLHEMWKGATPFWLAARFLEVQSLRALAAAGADPNLASADGTTALMSAAGQGYSRGGGEGAFIRDRRDFSSYNPVAAEGGGGIPAEEEKLAYEAVSIVLDSGGQVSAANRAGDTALHSATVLGMASVVRLLVERGADVNAKNKAGLTPLGVATRSGRRAGGGTAGVAEFLKLNGGR